MKRKAYLDIARFLAIIAVVLLHTVSGILDSDMTGMLTSSKYYFYSSIKAVCSFCVPLFVMISGALFLNPKKIITLQDLFGKYIRRLVLALVIFGTIYAEMELIFTSHGFRLVDLWTAVCNMLKGQSWAHMWYLYMLIGLYLIMPILKGFVSSVSKEVLYYILILLVVFQSILPILKMMTGFELGIQIPINSIYVFYFLAGYYCVEYIDGASFLKRFAEILLLLSVAGTIIVTVCLGKDYSIGYDSPIIVLMALSLFLSLMKYTGENKFCTKMNPYIFGIYLIHTVVLNVLYKVLHVTPMMLGGYILIPIVAIVTFLISLAGVWLLRKIPFLRKKVL